MVGLLGSALGLAPRGVPPVEAATAVAVAAYVNGERLQRRLPALVVEPVLVDVASVHTSDMISAESLFHSSSLDTSAGPWQTWGENIGRGPSVEDIHRAMMASPHHADNILNPSYTSLGVSLIRVAAAYYVSELFVQRPSGYQARRLAAGGGSTQAINALSTSWHFAEGATWPGFDEYLAMVNPGDAPALVVAHLVGRNGPLRSQTISVPAKGRATLHVNDGVASAEVATTLLADRPIAAMRSMFVSDGFVSDGDVSPGAPSPSTMWYLAEGYTGEGFSTYLALYNPTDSPTEARFDYMTPAGPRQGRPVSMAPHTRSTVLVNADVPDTEVATKVTSSVPIVVERTEEFLFRGIPGWHNKLGFTEPLKELNFAEGYTGRGFQEYLVVQNPQSEPVTARLSLVAGAASRTFDIPLAPLSRATVDVNAVVGPDHEVAAVISAGSGILAERVEYFSRPTFSGGHVAHGGEPTTFAVLPEGYAGAGYWTYVLLFNFGGQAATASLTYLTETGPLNRAPVSIPPHSRVTLDTSPDVSGNFGVLITSDQAIVVEEAEYFRKIIE
jgi:hypothetical protein